MGDRTELDPGPSKIFTGKKAVPTRFPFWDYRMAYCTRVARLARRGSVVYQNVVVPAPSLQYREEYKK
jgi:hypothetical protein